MDGGWIEPRNLSVETVGSSFPPLVGKGESRLLRVAAASVGAFRPRAGLPRPKPPEKLPRLARSKAGPLPAIRNLAATTSPTVGQGFDAASPEVYMPPQVPYATRFGIAFFRIARENRAAPPARRRSVILSDLRSSLCIRTVGIVP